MASPLGRMLLVRTAWGITTLFAVSVIVFFATQVLPGDAATAILGKEATPERLQALRESLHLEGSPVSQFWSWLSHAFRGDFGNSLQSGRSVLADAGFRTVNTLALLVPAAMLSIVIGVGLGVVTAVRRDTIADHVINLVAVCILASPLFITAVAVVILFATTVTHLLPAVTLVPPGARPWDDLPGLVLPVTALVLSAAPYIFRMVRGTALEAMDSDYVQMAILRGIGPVRLITRHVLPNIVAPVIQVIGLVLAYLAGGIVVLETVFAYPGIGLGLVDAVSGRDLPTVQFLTVLLAAFYVVINLVTDVIALLATPRRRIPR